MIEEPTAPIEIFICYAREDEEYRQGLEKQLRILKRQGFITIWHDREIIPGTEWQSEIDRHLKSAQIILLLVSPDFMDSDYCYSIEMQNAMERHQHGEAYVMPIIVHHVYWQEAPIGKLQVLPTDARPITDHSWHNLNEAFYNVAIGIREVIEKVNGERQRKAKEGHLHTSLSPHGANQISSNEQVSLRNPSYEKGMIDKKIKEYNEQISFCRNLLIIGGVLCISGMIAAILTIIIQWNWIYVICFGLFALIGNFLCTYFGEEYDKFKRKLTNLKTIYRVD